MIDEKIDKNWGEKIRQEFCKRKLWDKSIDVNWIFSELRKMIIRMGIELSEALIFLKFNN